MNRLAVLLLMLLIPSALYLVKVRHESRQLFAAVERAKQEQRKLNDEAMRLQARRTELTSATAAERGAERLGMRLVTPEHTWYVTESQPPVTKNATKPGPSRKPRTTP
jgi:cell division protein FtsL